MIGAYADSTGSTVRVAPAFASAGQRVDLQPDHKLIVLGFNKHVNLGGSLSSPTKMEIRDRRNSTRDERGAGKKGTGMKLNKKKKKKKKKNPPPPLTPTCYKASMPCPIVRPISVGRPGDGRVINLYKLGTSNSVSWSSELVRRARNGHIDVSIIQQVLVSRHNVLGHDTAVWRQKNGTIFHHPIQKS